MADQRISIFSGTLKRLKEMMDGTFAEVVVAARLNAYQSVDAAGISALAPIATLTVDGLHRVNVEVQVSGAALSAFQILGQGHASGSWQLLYSSAADYAAPVGLLVGANRSDGMSDLTSTPAGVNAFFNMDVAGFYAIQLKAASSGVSAAKTMMGGQ